MDDTLTMLPIDLPAIRLVEPARICVNTLPWAWETCIPAYYNFWYSLTGYGEMRLDDKPYAVKPGVAFLLAPGTRVTAHQSASEPITNFAAHLVFRADTGRMPAKSDLFLGTSVPSRPEFDARVREIASRARSQDPLTVKEAESMVFLALARIWRYHRQKDGPFLEKLESLLDAIDAQPGKFTCIEQLCAATGSSEAHLRRLFLERVGTSPLDYIIRRRIERAKSLLSSSPLQVKEVADSLGYDDPFYFSRQFKRYCGVSPQHWRRQPASRSSKRLG